MGFFSAYICNNARKHQCGKKTVKKDWIEDLVIKEVLALISSDAVINELADRVYDLQAAENTSVLVARNKLAEVKKKLRNLAEAIANGLYSSTTKELLDELEEQKSNLENELSEMQKVRPFLSKEEILFILYSYRKINIKEQKGKQKLIDGFINSIYLFDDYFIITFNYKNQSKTVTLEEIEASLLTPKGSP